MRYAMAAVLAIGLGVGVYGCTQAQRDAAKQGASDGASGAPVAPPSGWDNFPIYMLAYLAGTSGKEGLKYLKGKITKA